MLINKISKIIIFLGAIGCTALYGCKDNPVLPDQPIGIYTQVYMPEAANGPVVKVLKVKDSVQTAIYGAVYGGYGYPKNDVPVTFKIDKAKVDSFNIANKTAYPVLPDGSYTLSNLSSVIPQGGVNTPPLTISFKTTGAGAMDAFKTYLLPISIAGTTVKVNEALRTTFYKVTAQPDFNDYTNYDRAKWVVTGFSSQEAVGEGANNGRAIFAIDGSTATYWHTQYKGAAPIPPHFLTIDMGEVKMLHGLSFVGRQSTDPAKPNPAGKPNEVNVQVSTDNVVWVNAGTFNLQNNPNLQKIFLPEGFKSARYFKVVVNSAYSATYTQIADLNAF